MAEEPLVEADDLGWEKTVEKGTKPVAVMFYSPRVHSVTRWSPILRITRLSARDSVVFVRINIMTNQWTAERYSVRSTPTFKFFCDGKPVQEMVGAIYPALLKKWSMTCLFTEKNVQRILQQSTMTSLADG